MKPEYKQSLAFEEIEKSIGIYNLTATIEEDAETLVLFSHVPGLIAFKATLAQGDLILGIGRGTATLNRMSKYVDRGVCYAKNASLIDAMVRSTKTLDALYLKETGDVVRETEKDIEGRDKVVFYGNEDMPKYASDKQRNFLKKLVSKCKDSNKREYEHKLESPYLSSFECSALIKNLLTK